MDYSEIRGMNTHLGLFIVRVVTGVVFFMHGWQKLVDNGLDGTRAGFEAMDVPLPAVTSVIVTFVELFGGLALIVGALTPWFSVLLLIDMVAAFFIVHVENGFFVTEGGFELVLLLGGVALGLIFTGAGRFSVDDAVGLPTLDGIFGVGEPSRR